MPRKSKKPVRKQTHSPTGKVVGQVGQILLPMIAGIAATKASIHRCRRYPTKFNSGRDIPKPTVELVKSDYQPTKAELEEDIRMDVTFEEAVKVLTQPVKIRWINRPKPAG